MNNTRNHNTTRKLCRLQIQKQLELDAKEVMENDMYINPMTEEELDGKIKFLLESRRLLNYQKDKIRRYFRHIKKTGWFYRFEYHGYKCAVELDEIGRWRIYFKPLPTDLRNPFEHHCDCDYCGFYQDNSSRFSIRGFPLGLWNYHDKIGLDDFIGMASLHDSIWFYDYFGSRRFKFYDNKIYDITYSIRMCKKLVHCWIRYQERGDSD